MKVIIAAIAICAILCNTVVAGLKITMLNPWGGSSVKFGHLNRSGADREFSVSCPGSSVKIDKALFGCNIADEEGSDVTARIQELCADQELCEFKPVQVFGESWIAKCNGMPGGNLAFQAWYGCSQDMQPTYW